MIVLKILMDLGISQKKGGHDAAACLLVDLRLIYSSAWAVCVDPYGGT
jgi:hypothetical protein